MHALQLQQRECDVKCKVQLKIASLDGGNALAVASVVDPARNLLLQLPKSKTGC